MTRCLRDHQDDFLAQRFAETIINGDRHQCVSVLVLCRDNPEQLHDTLISVLKGAQGLEEPLEVLVVDGSLSSACTDLCKCWVKSDQPWFLHHHRQQSQGIYAALNEGIGMVRGQLLACMNSGDAYCPGGLTALVNHWKFASAQAFKPLPAVFAQAWVEAVDGQSWLSPAPTMRNLSRWLRLMVPCHQAMLFDLAFARQHPYPTNSLIADRVVMRAALLPVFSEVYLPQPVCFFRLDGVSSRWPTWRLLIKHLQDPHRHNIDRMSEVVKWCLRPVVVLQPWLMRVKSWFWGLCCSR